MRKEKLNIPGLEKYDVTGGTIMLIRNNDNPEIGVPLDKAVTFVQELIKKQDRLLYCAVRKSGPRAKDGKPGWIHIDFSYAAYF